MSTNLYEPADALRAVAIVLSLGQLLSASESFYLHASGLMQAWLPWKIIGLRGHRAPVRLDWLFSRSELMSALAVTRALAAATLLVSSPTTELFSLSIAILLTGMLIESYRTAMGGEGADQMFLLIACALLLGGAPGSPRAAQEIALAFIAGQAVLSYTASGVSKLFSPMWRSGEALSGILSTYEYGWPRLGGVLAQHGSAAFALTWVVLAFESTFALSLADQRLTIAYMLFGLLFHLTNAGLMGLTAFCFAFPATYPALVWAVGALHSW